MTEAITYRCEACGRAFGPLGMHGYDPTGGNGEIPVVCQHCRDVFVGRVAKHSLVPPGCYRCGEPWAAFDGRCPACGSEELFFTDLNFPEIEGFPRPRYGATAVALPIPSEGADAGRLTAGEALARLFRRRPA
jgi:DNA-directed RNA polymerase subunit RPC12/RpoP